MKLVEKRWASFFQLSSCGKPNILYRVPPKQRIATDQAEADVRKQPYLLIRNYRGFQTRKIMTLFQLNCSFLVVLETTYCL